MNQANAPEQFGECRRQRLVLIGFAHNGIKRLIE
jgi:hypothetical protein